MDFHANYPCNAANGSKLEPSRIHGVASVSGADRVLIVLVGENQTLEERDRRHTQHKDQLYREQRFLRRKMEQLGQQYEAAHQLKRRANSLSECSVTSSTTSSASSAYSLASSTSETGITAFDGTYLFFFC